MITKCDICGRSLEQHELGQSTADTVLCTDCLKRFANDPLIKQTCVFPELDKDEPPT